MKKLDGNNPKFCQQLMDLASQPCTCSYGTEQISVFEHPAYSPDLAPTDFFLFLKVKEILKGRHFDDIRSNTMGALKAIPQNQFQNCFEGWTMCWHQCIASQGQYYEGNHGGIQQ
jgi:hypothetical protein